MNPKLYLTSILIFITICLFNFSVKSQNNSDSTIRMVNKGLGYDYYQGNVMLSFKQVMYLTKSNPEAFKLMIRSDNMRSASIFFGFVGGVSLGYSAGYMLGRFMTGRTFEEKIFYPILGAGAALIFIGIGFSAGATDNARKGIAVFNNGIKQSNNANFDLGFYPGGAMLRLNF